MNGVYFVLGRICQRQAGSRRGRRRRRRPSARIGLVLAAVAAPVVALAPAATADVTPTAPSLVDVSGDGFPDGAYSGITASWDGGGPGSPVVEVYRLVNGRWTITKTLSADPAFKSAGVGSFLSFCCNGVFRVGVHYVDGGVAGDRTFSPAFDSTGPPKPRITSIQPWIDGRVLIRWSSPPPPPDTTPNDPFDSRADVDATAPRGLGLIQHAACSSGPYWVLRELYGGGAGVVVEAFAVDPRTPLFSLGSPIDLVAMGIWDTGIKEYTGFQRQPISTEPSIYLKRYHGPVSWHDTGDTRLSAAIPAKAIYGRPTIIPGRVTTQALHCPSSGSASWLPSARRRVVLQASRFGYGPWYGVTATTTSATGGFMLRVATPGTRYYRVAVLGASWPRHTMALAGQVTEVGPDYYGGPDHGLVRARTRVRSAGFVDSTAYYGQRVTARVWVSPASRVTTTLQRWTGAHWVGVKYVRLLNGFGAYSFSAVRRGTTAYRFRIPGTTAPNGLPVDGTSTPSFRLTVR